MTFKEKLDEVYTNKNEKNHPQPLKMQINTIPQENSNSHTTSAEENIFPIEEARVSVWDDTSFPPAFCVLLCCSQRFTFVHKKRYI